MNVTVITANIVNFLNAPIKGLRLLRGRNQKGKAWMFVIFSTLKVVSAFFHFHIEQS